MQDNGEGYLVKIPTIFISLEAGEFLRKSLDLVT